MIKIATRIDVFCETRVENFAFGRMNVQTIGLLVCVRVLNKLSYFLMAFDILRREEIMLFQHRKRSLKILFYRTDRKT